MKQRKPKTCAAVCPFCKGQPSEAGLNDKPYPPPELWDWYKEKSASNLATKEERALLKWTLDNFTFPKWGAG